MTNAQEIFDIAMDLMDERDETTGKTDTADTREYKNRTLSILNILAGELYPYSDTYAQSGAGVRPIVFKIKSFSTNIDLDDFICQSVLPYGLAAQLLLDENPASADFFQQRYEELRRRLERGFPVESESIVDVYGGLQPYQDFGAWG